ncbi:MAG: hypothetical protein V1754_02405 [Pseudomonadota bacterium]
MLLKTAKVLMLFVGVLFGGGCGSSDSQGGQDGGPNTSNLPEEELVEACIRLHACGVQNHVRLSDCINDFHNRFVSLGQRGLYQNIYSCVNTGEGNCKVVRECMGFAGRPVSCDNKYVAKCDGNIANNCDLIARWEQKLDCSNGGLKCAVSVSGTSQLAACGAGACDPAKFKTHCEDKKVLQCIGGSIEVEDCPELELQCRDDVAGVCEGTGRSCPSAQAGCDGNTLISCKAGYLSKTDCSKVFGKKKCDQEAAACKGSGTECSSDYDFDTCEGDALVVCVDNYKLTFDCKELGFEGCVKKQYGASCKALPVYE